MTGDYYMAIAVYVFLLTSIISITIFIAHLVQLAKLYVMDTSFYCMRTFLSKRIQFFEADSLEEFCLSTFGYLFTFLVLAVLAVAWPIYIVGLVGGTTYIILRCVRYFVRRSRQFKTVAKVLHDHPDAIQKERVNIPEVRF